MKQLIISSINQNLNKAIALLENLDSEIYTDSSVGPYYSSIGSHLRHALDFFDCIIKGIDGNNIDLTKRNRDQKIAEDREEAKNVIYSLENILLSYLEVPTDYLIHVTDDMGQGNVTVHYTLESILAHANSHLIHHYAIIGYILNHHNLNIKISGFGYNPTTPDYKRKGI